MSILIKITVANNETDADIKFDKTNGMECLQAIHLLSVAQERLVEQMLQEEFGMSLRERKSNIKGMDKNEK